MHNLGLFVIQKNKKTMIKEKGKKIAKEYLRQTNNEFNIDFYSYKYYNLRTKRW